jgi:hypothetical protein
MVDEEEYTTISVKKSTRDAFNEILKKNQTHDVGLMMLIEMFKEKR